MTELILPPGYDRGPERGSTVQDLERGMIVNETDLPDTTVERAVQTYFEEHASVFGISAGQTSFQTYANNAGSLLARTKFRPPANVIEEICLARDMAERDDDVSAAIGLMMATAFGDGMEHQHTDEVVSAVFDKIAENANLDAVWLELYREWLIAGGIATATLWTREDLQFTPEGSDRQRTRQVTCPLVGVLPAEWLRVVGNDLFRTGTLALKPATAAQEEWLRVYFDPATTAARKAELRAADPVMAQLVVGKLDVKDPYPNSWTAEHYDPAWGSTDLYRLNPRLVHRTTMAKGAWSYPRPPLTRNFPMIEAKRLLTLMDYALLQGGSNFLVVARKGSDALPATQPEVDSLHGTIRLAGRSGVMVGDHRLQIDVITPDLTELLNPAKRNLIGRKMANALLRVPEQEDDAGGEGMKARMEMIPRVLMSDRRLIKRHVEGKIYEEAVRRNSTLLSAPSVWFPRIILSGTKDFMDYALKLRDRADISRRTSVAVAGFDWDAEVRKRKAEKKDDRVMTPPPVPFSGQGGPQDMGGGRPVGSGPDNGRPGARTAEGPARARPRQVVNRTAGETVTARYLEETGTYRIGELTEALLESYDDAAQGRLTRPERDAIERIESGETAVLQVGALTVVPVNQDEQLAEIRAVRLDEGLSALVGYRSDDALMCRALVFREPHYDELGAVGATLRFGFDVERDGEEDANGAPLVVHVHTGPGEQGRRLGRAPRRDRHRRLCQRPDRRAAARHPHLHRGQDPAPARRADGPLRRPDRVPARAAGVPAARLRRLLHGRVMPVRRAKGGYRWGRTGKVYRGRGAKKKAARQGRAVRASQRRRRG